MTDIFPTRMNLCNTDCIVRDARWEIHINAGDDPIEMRVAHRKYGDYYEWPEAVVEGQVRLAACLRAYDLQDGDVRFHTRGRAVQAAHGFLKAYGDGEVEYLEWDVDSQSHVVVGHKQRNEPGLWWPPAKPDLLDRFCTLGHL